MSKFITRAFRTQLIAASLLSAGLRNEANAEGAVEGAPVVQKKAGPTLKKLAQFQTPDGKIFATQKEASEHLRVHLKVEAVNTVAAEYTGYTVDADGNSVEQSLGDFLLANEAKVRAAYDAAKVERAPVSEETKAKMKAAREKLKQKAINEALEAAGIPVPAEAAAE